MTLVLCLGNSEQTVMLSDRRLVSNGLPLPATANKGAVLVTRDARIAVGFAGLASVGDFDTKDGIRVPGSGLFDTELWIAESLIAAAPPEFLLEPMVAKFAELAEQRFQMLRVRHPAKPLEIGFAGYQIASGATRKVVGVVSNFTAKSGSRPNFTVDFGPQEQTYELALGLDQSLTQSDLDALGRMLRERRPARALVGKAVEVMRQAAGSRKSRGWVGEDLNSLVIPATFDVGCSAEYHPSGSASTIYGPNVIEARGGEFGCMIIAEPQFRAAPFGTPDGPILAVRKLGRNEPCPCRSGKKYKYCHGGS